MITNLSSFIKQDHTKKFTRMFLQVSASWEAIAVKENYHCLGSYCAAALASRMKKEALCCLVWSFTCLKGCIRWRCPNQVLNVLGGSTALTVGQRLRSNRSRVSDVNALRILKRHSKARSVRVKPRCRSGRGEAPRPTFSSVCRSSTIVFRNLLT